jgi:capsule polysaccharide modification protein KpsS
MLHILQVFQRYVAIISYECCKSRSVMLHILQVFQRHVASVLEMLFKMFHLSQTYVASVLIWMLYMFYTYVARICFNCFSLMLQYMFLWSQVASILSDVF